MSSEGIEEGLYEEKHIKTSFLACEFQNPERLDVLSEFLNQLAIISEFGFLQVFLKISDIFMSYTHMDYLLIAIGHSH